MLHYDLYLGEQFTIANKRVGEQTAGRTNSLLPYLKEQRFCSPRVELKAAGCSRRPTCARAMSAHLNLRQTGRPIKAFQEVLQFSRHSITLSTLSVRFTCLRISVHAYFIFLTNYLLINYFVIYHRMKDK